MEYKECTLEQFSKDETVYEHITVFRITTHSTTYDTLIYDIHLLDKGILIVHYIDNVESGFEVLSDYLVSINEKTNEISYCNRCILTVENND